MKLIIKSDGIYPDDNLAHYTLVAENDSYKGTGEFFQYADVFREFAQELLAFPFESKLPVCLDATDQGVMIEVSLKDLAGAVACTCSAASDGGQMSFTDSVEVEALHHAARKLLAADFSSPCVLKLEL